jgi:flagellar basal-body rod protein FlgB
MAKNVDMSQLLESGLKLSTVKQKVIANNLANLETPGYRRSAVSFESKLSEALQDGSRDLNDVQAAIIKPMNTEVSDEGNDVNLDLELGGLIKNTSQYKLYMRMLAKTYQQMTMAMSGE